MLRFLFTLILSFSSLHAQDKLNPGYDIPHHVQFIFKMYQAIDREDKELINPKAFDREDLHYALTLFFDPTWGDKPIPTTLSNLEVHYNKRRKICTRDFTKILTPYWAHKKCLEVLDRFDPDLWETEESIRYDAPIYFYDPLHPTEQINVNIHRIISLLSGTKEDQTPMWGDLRQSVPLEHALPTEIENPLFLMALAYNVEFLVGALLEIMQDYTEDKIQENQFAQALKQSMRPDNDLADTFQFDYINWYIQHYDVFGEGAS